MKASFSRKILSHFKAKNVYDEFQPLLIITQLTGFAPYTITRNGLKPSKLLIAHSFTISIILLYSFHETWTTQELNFGHQRVKLILSHFLDSFAVGYTIFCLIKYVIQSRVCMDMWIKMNEINVKLKKINIEINFTKSKVYNIVITFIFLCLFGIFLIALHYLQSIEKNYLSLGFWIICFLPIFQSCVMEYSFTCWTLSLKKKSRLLNGALGEEMKAYEKGKEIKKCYAILFEERRRTETFRLLEKIRVLKEIHFKVYEIVKCLNSLLGTHFLYIFVIYFFSGTLNGYNIIRMYYTGEEPANASLASAWTWTAIQVTQILNIVFTSMMVTNEARV